jgi:hypothetical protein
MTRLNSANRRMRILAANLGLMLLSSPAWAASYHIVLEPFHGSLLRGHAGVAAVDDRTATALVRLITPGNEVAERGTLRVLVMNEGGQPFEFGPDQVQLTLADGTTLKASSIDQFEKGRLVIEHESRLARASDFSNRNNLAGLDQQANSGATARSAQPMTGGNAPSAGSNTVGQDDRSDDSLLPGAEYRNAIYQLLIPQTVAPQHAWGGYYVFDVPRRVLARKADQPLTVVVRTGGEIHRFAAILKWK